MTLFAKFPHIVRENEPLAQYSWLRIGGKARYFAEPTTVEELSGLVKEASAAGLTTRILGGGSNLLIRESGVDGLVISLAAPDFSQIEISGSSVTAGAGAKLGHLVSRTVGAGLAGLEHLVGIPGTVGGAIVGNAGVIHDDLGSSVIAATVMNRDGTIARRDASGLQFAFRRSNLDDTIVLSIDLKLETGGESDLTRRMQSSWIIKRANQPSTDLRTVLAFVEPDGVSLGELFETAGVRGASDGEATLSAQFPGYIIASGAITSDQVLALIAQVRRAVELKTGIALQSQLRIW
jgi:UDP-N-acetylmuramate dehydrogenase